MAAVCQKASSFPNTRRAVTAAAAAHSLWFMIAGALPLSYRDYTHRIEGEEKRKHAL